MEKSSNEKWGHKIVLTLDITFIDIHKQLSDALGRPPTVEEVRRVCGQEQFSR